MGEPTIQPVSGTAVPRYAGPSTFVRLPELRDLDRCDVAILGVPFDSGVSFRPGARFGPSAIRQASRMLRPQFHPIHELEPFAILQGADAGDVACNPFDIMESIGQIERGADEVLERAGSIVSVGGDHTVLLPLLRSMSRKHGPVALVHFDAHLDTWDTYFGAPYTHGTLLRRAAEEGLFLEDASMHVGIRGPLYSAQDIADDAAFGFRTIRTEDVHREGVEGVVQRIRERVVDHPLYVSIDIDSLDPSHAPGTGTPEIGGLTSRELLMILRALAGLRLVSADVVEVSPPYDHAELTSLAAATVVYELVCLLAGTTEAS
ncbi:MAG: agmatinase [Actinomycetia bacterium]|jgi:agmatinase|nr:agmatinase [Actinomycetes bacterium]